MYKLFHLNDRELDRVNNRPYYRGTWEVLRMAKNRLLPFQVKTDGSALEVIHIQNAVETNITTYLNGLTDVHSDYTSYLGDRFSDYLPEGRCYFKINNKYSEDVDVMDLSIRDDLTINTNLVTGWTNVDYSTLNTSGAQITLAENGALAASAYTNEFELLEGDTVRTVITFAKLAGSVSPTCYLKSGANEIEITISADDTSTNTETNTVPATGAYRMYIESDVDDTAYFGMTANVYNISDIDLDDVISSEYIKLTISSETDFSGIYYRGGFKQVIFKRAVVERGQGADIEIIGDERNGVIVKEKVITGTRYRVKLKVTEPEFSALVQAMPAVWQITETSGKVFTCYNKELSDPVWYNGNGVTTLSFTDNLYTYAQNNDDL